MKRALLLAASLTACSRDPAEQYGFVTTLGSDTVSVESVSRRGDEITVDAVDRFPRVRQRHAVVRIGDDGGIKRVSMDIHTPSEPESEQDRRVEANVTTGEVRVTKHDGTGTVSRTFKRDGNLTVAHVPQLYSLYEMTFAAALKGATKPGDTVRFRQFYIDREFDNFPFHRGFVVRRENGKAEIRHDWLSGIGEATFDSAGRLLGYNGTRTTYDVRVHRTSDSLDIKAIGDRYAALEKQQGGVKSLSVRDTTRQTIGGATFLVDYGRPLARGRVLLGNVIRYGSIWRTGANAATQFSTSAPITIGNLRIPAGMYTLWTVPSDKGADLIVNKQTGQWGTSYDASKDLGRTFMQSERPAAPVEIFTISINPSGSGRGTLVMEWGTFRWSAPITVN